MDLLAWFRRRPLPGTVDQTLALLRTANDPTQRAAYIDLLHDQVAVLHDASGDAAQRAVISMEGRLSEQLQTQFGVTNEMISQAVAEARGSHIGVGRLQDQLTTLEGRFSDLGEALNDRLDGHDAELKQLHVGQDQIKDQVGGLNSRHGAQIEEIKVQLGDALRRLEQSSQDRADLRARVEQLERERGGHE
jgi:hypothetical protein